MSAPTILVVDDEKSQALAVCDILNLNGYAATSCTSASQALAALKLGTYDLLFSDLMMPGMDGIALLRAALAIDPTLVVMIMTGAGTIASAVEAMKAGALDVILKPFKPSGILPAVARAMIVRNLRAENLRLQTSLRDHSTALEVANRGQERMLAIVSHDLRAPLLGISASIDLLTDHGEVAASGLPLCAAIRTEASHLVDLATDLIDVTRIARGQMPWHWDGIDPCAVINEVVAALHSIAAQANIALVAGPAPAGRVPGDGSACRRLLINLVANAFRHAAATTITVSAERRDAELRFVVTDDGRGIDPRVVERLGLPFAISGAETPLGGVGLGLAICLGIAAAHGGHISIHSRPGKGTRVEVTLRGDLPGPEIVHGQERFRDIDLGAG